MSLESVILENENRLREAQLASDVTALSALIADELQFVFHDGNVYAKQMDLDAHRAGLFKFKSIEFSERKVTCLSGDLAVTTTRAKLAGSASGRPFEDEVRYLRTWLRRDGRWQVVAGSVSRIAAGEPQAAR